MRKRSIGSLSLLLALVALGGCVSHGERLRPARELYYAGQVAAAAEQLEEQLPRGGSERDVIALDLAMAQLFNGQPETAERTLREVRDRFDHFEQQDMAELALSFLTDDTRRAYAGEDYEKVLNRYLLALCSLMGDGQDAEAYSLQVTAKQQEIIERGAGDDAENPKLAYQRVAAGAHLYGILREANHGSYDDAERSFAKVVSWQPGFQLGGLDLERARTGRHSQPGNGVLYVFAFVGRGPYKRQVSEVPTSQALLIADRILTVTGKHSLPPTIAPIKVPQVVTAENRLDGVLVSLGNTPAGTTDTLTDVGQLAVQQYQAIYPHVIARAVARRAMKKAAVYAAKDQLGGYSSLTGLAMDAAGVVWEATESADTRCWALLPDKIQVLRLELPAGEHEIALRPTAGPVPLAAPATVRAVVEDGRNTYLLACYPESQLAGRILVSTR